MRGARAAGRCALRDSAPIRMGVEQGEHAGGVFTLAIFTGDWRIGLVYRAQGVKFCPAIQADIFV